MLQLSNRILRLEVESRSRQEQDGRLKKFLGELQYSSLSADTNIASLQARTAALESRDPYWIRIDPSASGFQRVATSVGPLLVSSKDASPFLDGYKIKLDIGNPYSISYGGFALAARWGKPLLTGSDGVATNFLEYLESQKEKEEKVTTRLLAGTWNEIEFTITPARAEELRELRVKISPNEILMATDPRSK